MKMKRVFILLAAVPLTLAGCANYDSDINRIDEELDRIENTRIKTIAEQIDGINASLPKLEQADKDLKEMIASLQGTAEGLKKAIEENESKISAVKTDLEKALTELREADTKDKEEVMAALIAAKAEITAKLEAMKTEAEDKLKSVESTIAGLQEKDSQLEKRINELKEYVNSGLSGTKDWALKTFSTLESQKAIEEDITSIKGSVEGLKTSLSDLEKRLSEKFSKDLESAVAGLDSKISEQVAALTTAYTEAIASAKSEIESAYTAAIETAIKDLETSLKSWVNETLTAYSTIASTESMISTLKTELEGQLESQETYLENLVNALSKGVAGLAKANDELTKLIKANAEAIEANKAAIAANAELIEKLNGDLTAAKKEIKSAYEKAIGDAISASEGKLTDKITDEISKVNDSIDAKVKEVKDLITDLTTRVETLEKDVKGITDDLAKVKDTVKNLEDRLNSRIQSISYIPTYTDRVEEVYFTVGNISYIKDLTLQFEVMPHDMAQKITVDQVSGQATYPQTRAGSLTSFEVKSVSGDADGILTVVIDPIKFLNNDHYSSYTGVMSHAAVRVAVSDSKTGVSVASEYVSVEPKKYNRFMSYTTTTGKELDRYCYTATDNDDKKVKTVSSQNSETGEWTMSVPYGSIYANVAGKIDFNMWYNQFSYPSPVARDNSLKKISFERAYPYYYLKDDATRMFFEYINLEEADLAELRVNDDISMKEMFIGCSKLEVVKLWNRLSGNKIMENVTSTEYMFSGCSSLNTLTLPQKVNSGKLESMSYMFNGCSSLTAIDLSGWNLNNVTIMGSLFQNCSGLTSVALPKVTSKKIQYMQRMFSGCSALTSVDLSGWNVENVTEMGDLFYGCYNLKDVNLSGWVPKSLTNIYRMFSGTGLENINLSGWNLEKVETIAYMFSYCTNLKTVDLSGWKTPNLNSVIFMFNGCKNLTSANLSGWDVSRLTTLHPTMFMGCESLETLDLSRWNLDNVATIDSRTFSYCKNLKTVRMVGCSQKTIDKIKAVLPSGAKIVTK